MTVILGNAHCKSTYFLLLTPELLQVTYVRNDDNQLSFLYANPFLTSCRVHKEEVDECYG
jgi:hypothetical protein